MANPSAVARFASSAISSGRPLTTYEAPPSIGRQKLLLRRQVRSVLEDIAPESLAVQGDEVLQHLNSFTPYLDARRVSCYKSMSSAELPTDSIIKNLLETTCKKVFLPYIHDQKKTGTHRMEMLELKTWQAFQTDLVPVSFSSSSTSPQVFQFNPAKISGLENARDEGLDLILLPGLAFDRYGNRLGHGKGYYDEYLNDEFNWPGLKPSSTDQADHEHNKKKKNLPILVGICLREQLLLSEEEYIPTQAHDRRLDFIVSPDGVFPRIR